MWSTHVHSRAFVHCWFSCRQNPNLRFASSTQTNVSFFHLWGIHHLGDCSCVAWRQSHIWFAASRLKYTRHELHGHCQPKICPALVFLFVSSSSFMSCLCVMVGRLDQLVPVRVSLATLGGFMCSCESHSSFELIPVITAVMKCTQHCCMPLWHTVTILEDKRTFTHSQQYMLPASSLMPTHTHFLYSLGKTWGKETRIRTKEE